MNFDEWWAANYQRLLAAFNWSHKEAVKAVARQAWAASATSLVAKVKEKLGSDNDD